MTLSVSFCYIRILRSYYCP
uniref:Uncharacterized protein n=1 Tax=Arundo donax TaxID=35708 RepID=A0A0A8Z1T4_ARUDO